MPLCAGGLRLVVMLVSVPLLVVGPVLAAEQAIDWGFFAGTLYLLALFLFEPQTPLSGDYLANPPG